MIVSSLHSLRIKKILMISLQGSGQVTMLHVRVRNLPRPRQVKMEVYGKMQRYYGNKG